MDDYSMDDYGSQQTMDEYSMEDSYGSQQAMDDYDDYDSQQVAQQEENYGEVGYVVFCQKQL